MTDTLNRDRIIAEWLREVEEPLVPYAALIPPTPPFVRAAMALQRLREAHAEELSADPALAKALYHALLEHMSPKERQETIKLFRVAGIDLEEIL